MSVFKKLKGTIQKSQQDLVNGLRTLASLDGHLRHDQLQHIRSKDINLNAGADLLSSYQHSWSVIQDQTKECSQQAEKVAAELDPLLELWETKSKVVSDLEEEVKHIPGTVSSLKEMQTLISTLRSEFAAVEESLDLLENLCEELDLQKKMVLEQKKLANYNAMKMTQAEKVKVDMARSHAKRMSDLELAKRNHLQERAQAFTSVFEKDMEFYKTHGHPDVAKLPVEFPKVSSLSDIEIDQDKKALDSFLGPSDQDGAAEAETDEPYFEDDYTSDYTVKQDDEFIEERDLNSIFFDDDDDNDEISRDRLSQDEEEEEDFQNAQETNVDFKEVTETADEVESDLKSKPLSVGSVDVENDNDESKIPNSDIPESSVPSS